VGRGRSGSSPAGPIAAPNCWRVRPPVGGLRLAVVGRERLGRHRGRFTGWRCSAGARVVHVEAGELDPAGVARDAGQPARRGWLLLGGFGPGAATLSGCCWRNASRLAKKQRVQGTDRARGRAQHSYPDAPGACCARRGARLVATDTVLPGPGGRSCAKPARQAIAELLPKQPDRWGGVRPTHGPLPAPCPAQRPPRRWGVGTWRSWSGLRGRRTPGAVLVIDVGSSTTDVYSALPPSRPPTRSPSGHCLTVEADLGMRIAAPGILVEGQAQSLVDPMEADLLMPTVRRLAEEADFVPDGRRLEGRGPAAGGAAGGGCSPPRRQPGGSPVYLCSIAGWGWWCSPAGCSGSRTPGGLAAIRDTLRARQPCCGSCWRAARWRWGRRLRAGPRPGCWWPRERP